MTTQQHIRTLFYEAKPQPGHHPLWRDLRAAEQGEARHCVNHPGRVAWGGWDDDYYCNECMPVEIERRRLWTKSFGVVIGGVPALKGGA